jgi:hypothetical protein
MSKTFEQLAEELAATWAGVVPPNTAAREFAAGLHGVSKGFERQRGEMTFEEEPSSFEAALQETKERPA